jgi:hypothetical protein
MLVACFIDLGSLPLLPGFLASQTPLGMTVVCMRAEKGSNVLDPCNREVRIASEHLSTSQWGLRRD